MVLDEARVDGVLTVERVELSEEGVGSFMAIYAVYIFTDNSGAFARVAEGAVKGGGSVW